MQYLKQIHTKNENREMRLQKQIYTPQPKLKRSLVLRSRGFMRLRRSIISLAHLIVANLLEQETYRLLLCQEST